MSTLRRLLLVSMTVLIAGALASPAVPSALAAAPAAARTVSTGPCGDLHPIVASADTTVCTHGGDRAPTRTTREARRSAPASTVPPAPCTEDGVSGPRVRVLYGYPKGTSNRVTAFRPEIQQAVALADLNLDIATLTPPGKHYRLYCRTDTAVSVTAVRLNPIGKDGAYTFEDVMASLANQVALGFGKTNYRGRRFVYATFVDHIGCCYPYGGQATLQFDDRPDPTINLNNQTSGGKYSMIRLGMGVDGDAQIFQHEVGHNLGAVQDSAPHTSGGGHCFDGYDIMCYPDGGPYFAGGGVMTYPCPVQADGLPTFDCGGDDYYNMTPAPGSYLESHWDLTNSRWLTTDAV